MPLTRTLVSLREDGEGERRKRKEKEKGECRKGSEGRE
jgi:hypothetical protein